MYVSVYKNKVKKGGIEGILGNGTAQFARGQHWGHNRRRCTIPVDSLPFDEVLSVCDPAG